MHRTIIDIDRSDPYIHFFLKDRSSVGEHYLDTVGVDSSILSGPTIQPLIRIHFTGLNPRLIERIDV